MMNSSILLKILTETIVTEKTKEIDENRRNSQGAMGKKSVNLAFWGTL